MPSNPLTDPDWAPKLADTVERVVGKVRRVATDRAVKASRALVFGLLLLITLSVAAPIFVILVVRFVQVVISRVTRTDHDTTVWLTYMVIGAVMMLLGFFALRLRHGKTSA